MASITRISDGRTEHLSGTTTLGRSPGCDLSLTDNLVSGLHARVSFRRGVWSVDDLKSRNGTLLNGQPLGRDGQKALKVGDVLTFGSQQQQWRVDDLAAPGLFARASTGEVVSGDDFLALPNEDSPTATVYQQGDGQWVVEKAGEITVVATGHDIAIDDLTWRLSIPAASTETVENADFAPQADELVLHFAVSSDEEHVELEARIGDRRIDLKARAHHYLLLTLARARMKDAADPELPPTAHGWVYQDDLSRMLRLDDNAIYLAVYRARRQLKQAGIARAASLVERRSGTRQLRLGVPHIKVRTI